MGLHLISIHALLAESDEAQDGYKDTVTISIHALLAESDIATKYSSGGFSISIHALLAESDRADRPQTGYHGYFYPRSPCGERPRVGVGNTDFRVISIHALLAESDLASRLADMSTA